MGFCADSPKAFVQYFVVIFKLVCYNVVIKIEEVDYEKANQPL